ncbi:MAG: ribonucleoside-diphosphate reductase beta chain, partial [Polaribacter sp.]
MEITHIIKRDSEISVFELNKITKAIEKAMLSVNNGSHKDAIAITNI